MDRSVLIDGGKFAAVRRSCYLTQDELALRLEMSAANVRRLERSEVGGMRVKNFRRLAELLNVSPDALRAKIGVGPAPRGVPGGRRSLVDIPAGIAPDSVTPVVEIERFHGVSAARPDDHADDVRDTTPVPAGSRRRFSVTVDGDCMEPRYRDGEVVVFSVDAAEREGIVDGRSYFVQFAGGEKTFKRIFLDPGHPERLVLRCWNERYPPRTVERKDVKLVARALYKLVAEE